MTSPALRRLSLLGGLALAGQGLLVVTGILDHEASLPIGFACLLLGCAILGLLLAFPTPSDQPTPRPGGRSGIVLSIGAAATLSVLLYNIVRGSTLAAPEVAILAYGAALIVASRHLHRPRIAQLVAYSFPLALAPLSLYALNAALVSGAGATPLTYYIRHGLAQPMSAALSLLGIDVTLLGETVRLTTPRGALFLTVGIVCAGLYAMIFFLGVFALFAWDANTRGWRLAAYLALGLAGLHLANILRLILLGYVGWRWGGQALQDFHQHAGWALFLAWGIAYWWLVLRRFERPRGAGTGDV